MCPAYPADPERPVPPVRFRDEHPASRSRPVRAPVNPSVQILEISLEVQPVFPPRDPVHPRGGLGLSAQYAARKRSIDTWCKSAVNRTSLSFRATRRTRSRSLDTPSPALRPERVSLAAFPSGRPLPSTTSAPALPGIVRRLRR